MKITDRIQGAWNAFTGTEPETESLHTSFGGSGRRPGHAGLGNYTTSSFAASIFNRIAIDVATTTFEHVKEDGDDENKKDSALNYCLNVEANIDQTSKAFIQDLVYSMFDDGVIAVVPVETSISPYKTGGYEIHSMRVGKIKEWYPQHVRVEVYNKKTGNFEELYLRKENVAIIENPLFPVTNGEHSVLTRLIRKMNELDIMDEEIAMGKLDLLIQLPYAMKTNAQRDGAAARLKAIEKQLKENTHGMAYIDGTEKVTQLNRPVNDQLAAGVEKLTQDFYNQLGLTETIFNGTAGEAEIRLYYSRTIDPIVEYIIDEISRKFLTKTARTQGQKVVAYRDMFQFVSINAIADMSDKFRRNAILTSNEIRKLIRIPTHNDPRADELYNPNMPDDDQDNAKGPGGGGSGSSGSDPSRVKDDEDYDDEETKKKKEAEKYKSLRDEQREEREKKKKESNRT